MISALLVALIVVATFNGFDVASKTSADQRRHNQAAVLAAQSQEQLRSDPATALEALETAPHTYTQTLNGTTYTISESAKFINDSTQAKSCTAPGEVGKQNSSYLQVTSVVSWAALNTSRPKVEQSSIITPPTGSALEVDAVNGATPEEGVSGVGATVEYTGVESTQATTVEDTTGSNGCVAFGAIPATAATVKIKPPTGYVTPLDTFTVPSEAVTLAPNLTTHKEYTLNRGGAIRAKFTSSGNPVSGETFVAFNNKLSGSKFVLGSTAYGTPSEEHYAPLAGTFATTAETAFTTSPQTGNLFPYSSEVYSVYAGDCTSNNPTATSNPEGLKPTEVTVKPGETVPAEVVLVPVTLSVYTGKNTSSGLTSEALPVKITNTGCKEGTPNDATGPLYIHEQKLSGGHLEHQYQPFGSFSLCVYSAAKKQNYTVNYTNEKTAGSSRNILLGEGSISGEQTVESTGSSTPC